MNIRRVGYRECVECTQCGGIVWLFRRVSGGRPELGPGSRQIYWYGVCPNPACGEEVHMRGYAFVEREKRRQG